MTTILTEAQVNPRVRMDKASAYTNVWLPLWAEAYTMVGLREFAKADLGSKKQPPPPNFTM
jgi:hypothetical protein